MGRRSEGDQSFQKAQAYLDGLGVDAMKKTRPNMARIEALSEALDHPERAAPAIHVAGTNGKTSTARIVSSLLSASGLSVGTYTSPHLQTVRERIALNGEPISEEDFGDVFDHIRPFMGLAEAKVGESLTYFEILTAMFFLWAAETPVDAMVVEVGLGGRWDATNIVPSHVAVITGVGLDHTGLLGEDRRTIATEKAGIIKPGANVVTGERTPGVLEVIEKEVAEAGAPLNRLGRELILTDNRIAVGGRYLSLETSSGSYENLYLPLHGAHQGVNAAIGLEATLEFVSKPLSQEVVAEGFSRSVVPGRLETIPITAEDGVRQVVLDVAHNPDGVAAMTSGLVEAFAFERVIFVVAILDDKDYVGMLKELSRVPCRLIATRPGNVRSVPADQLRSVATALDLECTSIDDVEQAMDASLAEATDTDLVCVTGSHYVVGEARPYLLGSP